MTRVNIYHLILFVCGLLSALLVSKSNADIHDSNRKGYYRLEVAGELLPENYSEARTATDAAIAYWYACGDCIVRVKQPDIEVTGTRTPVLPPIEPEPEPEPPVEPEPEQPIEPPEIHPEAIPVAYYSETLTADGALADPQPLDGAHLPRRPVFMGWSGAYTTAVFYCCKGGPDDHRPAIADTEGTLLLSIDLGTLTDDPAQRELYTDLKRPDGSLRVNNFAYFTVEAAPEPPTPEPEPDGSDVTLRWTIPAQRENGTALEVAELWGYVVMTTDPDDERVAYGVPGGDVTEYQLDDLAAGTWDFSVKALDTGGLESAPSETITIELPGDE